MRAIYTRLYLPLVALGILAHLAIMVIPGNSILTPWSGGGDVLTYVLLARNLVSGYGYSYAHVPTAWRTPGYPLFIAGAMEIFGTHFVIAVRCLQGLLALLAAYLCMRASRIFFGETAARVSLLAALFFPTLIYFSGELLSESLSAFFLALFLWLFAEDGSNPRWSTTVGMGLAIGLGALVRPNLAAIGALGVVGSWLARRSVRTRLGAAGLLSLCAIFVFMPWIARNYHVFGKFVVTTKTGTDALTGTLNPEWRILPGWEDRERALIGHILPNEVETNAPSRVALGSEIDLDRKCWQVTRQLWSEMSWGEWVRVTLGKWATYWLSLDQLLHPGQISRVNRFLHSSAVLFYWLLLVMACIGWRRLKETHPQIAIALLGYVVLMTVLHTPFGMDTRIRAPLIDPLIATLAGGSCGILHRRETIKTVPSKHVVLTESEVT